MTGSEWQWISSPHLLLKVGLGDMHCVGLQIVTSKVREREHAQYDTQGQTDGKCVTSDFSCHETLCTLQECL